MGRLRVLLAAATLAAGSSLVVADALAAVKKPVVHISQLKDYLADGVVTGGQSGAAFSILKVERRADPGGRAETISIVYGDGHGYPLKQTPGFFHVNLERDPARVVIDLAQVQKTAIDSKELARLFTDSRFVRTTDMTMDPQDLSTNITLSLKSPAEMKVSTLSDELGARVVIQLRQGSAN